MKLLDARRLPVVVMVLAGLVALSLGFNAYLLWRSLRIDDRVNQVAGGAALVGVQVSTFTEQITALLPVIDDALVVVSEELESFQTSTIEFEVVVRQDIPVAASIPFQRTFTFPIETTFPIDEEFRTRIEVNGPFGIDIPLTVDVPINLEVPVDLDVSVPVDETIEVDTIFPLDLTIPVSVDLASTEFARLAERLQAGIEQIRSFASGFG